MSWIYRLSELSQLRQLAADSKDHPLPRAVCVSLQDFLFVLISIIIYRSKNYQFNLSTRSWIIIKFSLNHWLNWVSFGHMIPIESMSDSLRQIDPTKDFHVFLDVKNSILILLAILFFQFLKFHLNQMIWNHNGKGPSLGNIFITIIAVILLKNLCSNSHTILYKKDTL